MTKRNEVFQEILDVITEGGGLLMEWMENPHALRRRIRGTIPSEEWNRLFADKRKKRALRGLRKKKWIENKQKGNEIVFDLSNDAVIEYLKLSISQVNLNTHHNETLVIFDIPEVARNARQRFRRLLKKLGFRQAQLSVWSSLKDISPQMHSLITVLGIQKWVNVYRAILLN